MLNAFRFIFYTELLLQWRRSQEWLYPLAFFLLMLILFPLALTPDPHFLQTFFPGYLWIAALLASLLSIDTILLTEIEDGHIEQLLLSPLPLTLLLLIKIISRWLVTELPLIMLTPLLGWLFHLSFSSILSLTLSLLLGTPILTLMGSFGAALTHGLRQQGVLLGLLILPLILPVLIIGVNITQQSSAHLSLTAPCAALAGLTLLTATLLPFAMTAVLRFSLDE